ncbi:MAG: hypothetical protein AB8C95_10795 [Phycisphaeraceae bacterium]
MNEMKRQLLILAINLLFVGCTSISPSKPQDGASLSSFAQIQAGLPSHWKAWQDGKQIVVSTQDEVYFYNPISMPPSTIHPDGLQKYVKRNGIHKPYRIILSAGVRLEDSEFAKLQADHAEARDQFQVLKDEILPVYRKYIAKFMFSSEEPTERRNPYFFMDFGQSDLIKAEQYEERKRSLVFHKLPLFHSADHSVYVTDNNIFGLELYPAKTNDDIDRVMKLLGTVYTPYSKDAGQE